MTKPELDSDTDSFYFHTWERAGDGNGARRMLVVYGDEGTLERRIVTVLFADLVGFTPLSESMDPEDVAAIQDRYFALSRDTIERYGGRIDKYIGDAVMGVFGVPRSRDDDVERAVRAGLALIHGVEQLNAELGLDEDVLRLRVGINTGEAVAMVGGAYEGRITGDTVNTAQRFQSAAPAGGLLVGESTALAIADLAELGEPLRLELKGKAQPAVARMVTDLSAQPSREQAMGDLRAPTIGRERELDDLTTAQDTVIAGGVERWLIVAPPGVGKSRLLREFADRAAARNKTVVWRTRSRSGAVSPFDAIAGLMVSAMSDGPSSASGVGERVSAALIASGATPARARVVTEAVMTLASPFDLETHGQTPSDDRDALFAAWLDGLDVLSEDSTQVWLVEDVHWAGGDVIAFLDLAGSRPAPRGRLIIASARPSLLDEQPAWGGDEPGAGMHVMHLETLAPTGARELVGSLVGDALPADLVERIVQRSDGNCLFIEELLRTWVSVGTLVRTERRSWRLVVPADEVPLPNSVQQIYAAQLDDLPPDARLLARRASVAGRRFPVRALDALEAANEGLEPLRRRELVTGPLSEPLLGDAFSYRHALLRDAGYASLARAERARLHVRLARWLEEAAGDRATEVAEQIAGHYGAALDSAPALAREIDEGLDRQSVRSLAAEWYERSGQAALSLSAQDAARQLFRRAIDLTPDDQPLEQARRWERLGDATAFAADMDTGAAAYQRSIDLYRSAISKGTGSMERKASRTGLARATASLADVWYQQLRFADARDLAAGTLDELEAQADLDAESQARLLVARGMSRLGASGRSLDGEQDLERALELGRASGNPLVELRALEALTGSREEGGEDASDGWDRVRELAERVGSWDKVVGATINATSRSTDDHAADTFDSIARAREVAVAHGLVEDSAWTHYAEAEAAFVSGDWDRAMTAGAIAMDIGEANAYRRVTVRTVHVAVPIAGVRSDRDVLARAAAFYRSLEDKFEFPDSPYARVIRPAQDLELAANDLWTSYRVDPDYCITGFSDEPGGGSWSAALDRVFRFWIAASDVAGAARVFAAMTEALPRYPHVTSLGSGTYELLKGRLAHAQDDRDGAVDAGLAALASFRQSQAPWWIAKAIRLLERAGAADPHLVAEVEQIERLLGSVRPSQ